MPSDLFLPHSGKQAAARHMHPGQCLEINFTSSTKTKASRCDTKKTSKQKQTRHLRHLSYDIFTGVQFGSTSANIDIGLLN